MKPLEHLDLLRSCHLRGSSFFDARRATRWAAESGNVELVAYMLRQPCTGLFAELKAAAVGRGHTAMCQYLHQLHCPWGTDSTNTAAEHVHLVAWLMHNGCPWNEQRLCMAAVQGGSVEMLAHLQ
jgi:hypothetical protein